MMRFENTLLIDRPLQEVFAFLTRFENLPMWNYYVLEVQRTSSGDGIIGSTYHQRRKDDEQDYVVTDYVENERVTIRSLPETRPVFERTLHVEPAGTSTRVVDHWHLDMGFNVLIEKLAQGRIRSAVAENLDKLKELLETGHTQLQDGRSIHL